MRRQDPVLLLGYDAPRKCTFHELELDGVLEHHAETCTHAYVSMFLVLQVCMALYSDPRHIKHVPKIMPETQLPQPI